MNKNPEKLLRKELLKVNMPGRYVGGEYGVIVKKDAPYSLALCFPDLYEIGMSNQAVKIIYEMVNNETEAACERVFSPAPDFEEIMRTENIQLYTLESGKPVKDHDILAFTIGYELAATNILQVLDLSGVPLKNLDRKENDPIVIAGGPAVTNPVPFGGFIDAVYNGEAEGILPEIIGRLKEMKAEGVDREGQLDFIRSSDYFWHEGKARKVKRAVWNGFSSSGKARKLVVPSVKTVQDHGVVEIMRGCPNGCRFCHAGIFYRPYREKDISAIIDEVDSAINDCGYREVTLSSLSSGDYSRISELINILNKKYSSRKISFSFPSMRVNSVTLPLMSEISKVRKSGLTFAVETPELAHQRGLNKEAPIERIIEILKEAKKRGWKKAKFYFMIGLPFFNEEDETDLIIDFLREVGRETHMLLNVNIGTFIPKPHTPFQWSFQLTEERALEKIRKIKRALPDKFFKVGYQSPFMSLLEGIISRGDSRAGELILQAYAAGAKLDAWEEYMDKEVWREVISAAGWDVLGEICALTDTESELPWSGFDMNVGQKFLKDEYRKAFAGELTSSCAAECGHQCGSCSDEICVDTDKNTDDDIKEILETINTDHNADNNKKKVKMLFSFTKTGKASFLSHINVMGVFERSFLRGGIEIAYTEGFNPKPKLEFANPLTLGFESEDEIAAIEIMVDDESCSEVIENDFINSMNSSLPEGMTVVKSRIIKSIADEKTGKKVKSLMASYSGGTYVLTCTDGVAIEAADNIVDALSKKEAVEVIRADEDERMFIVKTGRDRNGRILNIFKFLSAECGFEHPFDIFEIKRSLSHCSLTDAVGTGKSDDYFSCYI